MNLQGREMRPMAMPLTDPGIADLLEWIGGWEYKPAAITLVGQNDWYLVTQLKNFKAGYRGSHADDKFGAQMIPMVGALIDQVAIENVVTYINTLGRQGEELSMKSVLQSYLSLAARPLILSMLVFLSACGAYGPGSGSVSLAQQPVVEVPTAATIGRFNESTNFSGVIAIPPGTETLYLSGAGASPNENGSWGTMEEQALQIFETYQATLDFEGINTGYRRLFGSDINPMKPVRSFVQVAALVREGWLVEVEIRAARMPQ
jgi:hypothetical protein